MVRTAARSETIAEHARVLMQHHAQVHMGEKLLSDREVGASHPESRSWPHSANRSWNPPTNPRTRNQPRQQGTPAHAAEECIEFGEDPMCPEPTAPPQPKAAYMATTSTNPPMTGEDEDGVYICAAQHFPGAYTATAAVADPPTTATPTATARANKPKNYSAIERRHEPWSVIRRGRYFVDVNASDVTARRTPRATVQRARSSASVGN